MTISNKIWLVGVSDAESNDVRYACDTKEKATDRWEQIRQELIQDMSDQYEGCKHDGIVFDEMYERILKNLSETDPEKMDNYPHDTPYIQEMEIE